MVFHTKGELKSHNKYKHSNYEKKYKCDKCDMVFHTNSNLKRHNKYKHSNHKKNINAINVTWHFTQIVI